MFKVVDRIRGRFLLIVIALAASQTGAADGHCTGQAEGDDSSGFCVRQFNDEELDRVLAEFGVTRDDPNYMYLHGSYIVENGRRFGDVLEVHPRPVHRPDGLCVVEPKHFSVAFTETGVVISSNNIWRQRFAALMDADRCEAITEDTWMEELIAAPLDVGIATHSMILGAEDALVSAVGEFAGFDPQTVAAELRLAQIHRAEDHADGANYCVSIFRRGSSVAYQVCVAAGPSQLDVRTVGHHPFFD